MYLRVLQTFLSQLPVSAAGTNCQDANSDSEDEDEEISKMTTTPVSSAEFLWMDLCYSSSSKDRRKRDHSKSSIFL